jgi:hypothetical protein
MVVYSCKQKIVMYSCKLRMKSNAHILTQRPLGGVSLRKEGRKFRDGDGGCFE